MNCCLSAAPRPLGFTMLNSVLAPEWPRADKEPALFAEVLPKAHRYFAEVAATAVQEAFHELIRGLPTTWADNEPRFRARFLGFLVSSPPGLLISSSSAFPVVLRIFQQRRAPYSKKGPLTCPSGDIHLYAVRLGSGPMFTILTVRFCTYFSFLSSIVSPNTGGRRFFYTPKS